MYNGDDHFLLVMRQKGVSGLADPLPYYFPQGKNSGHISNTVLDTHLHIFINEYCTAAYG